ncbi:hypothetical protein XENTR_v10012485 [Xenopus tropicalis]|nr:hypothetical protein XENTR_v10012485 [Xenopus tropicalis]
MFFTFKNIFLNFLFITFFLSIFYLRTEGNNFLTGDDSLTIPQNSSAAVTTLPATTDDREAYDDDVTEGSISVKKTADYGQEEKKDDTETSEATTDDEQEKEANDARKKESVEKATINVPSPVPASSALDMMEDLLDDLDLDNDRNVIIISTVAACGFLLITCSLIYLVLVISRLKHREKNNISHV